MGEQGKKSKITVEVAEASTATQVAKPLPSKDDNNNDEETPEQEKQQAVSVLPQQQQHVAGPISTPTSGNMSGASSPQLSSSLQQQQPGSASGSFSSSNYTPLFNPSHLPFFSRDSRDEEDEDSSDLGYSDDSASLSDAYFYPQADEGDLARPARYREQDANNPYAPLQHLGAFQNLPPHIFPPSYNNHHYLNHHHNHHQYPLSSYYGSINGVQDRATSPLWVGGSIQEDMEVTPPPLGLTDASPFLSFNESITSMNGPPSVYSVSTAASSAIGKRERRKFRKQQRQVQRMQLKQREQAARERAVAQIRGKFQEDNTWKDWIFAVFFILQLAIVLVCAVQYGLHVVTFHFDLPWRTTHRGSSHGFGKLHWRHQPESTATTAPMAVEPSFTSPPLRRFLSSSSSSTNTLINATDNSTVKKLTVADDGANAKALSSNRTNATLAVSSSNRTTSIPAFSSNRTTTIPAFTSNRTTSIPAFSSNRTTTIPAFSSNRTTTIPTFSSNDTSDTSAASAGPVSGESKSSQSPWQGIQFNDGFIIDYKNVVELVCITGCYACFLTYLSFGFMLILARSLIQIMLVFSIILSLAWGMVGLTLDPYGVISFMGFAALLLTLGYAMYTWSRIPFAATNLYTALCAMRCTADITLLGLASLIIAFGWCVIWSIAFIGIVDSLNSFGCDATAHCKPHMSIHHVPLYILLLFSFYWTNMVIKNVVRATVASAIGTWWFNPKDISPFCSSAVGRPLLRALTRSFGSLCLGSLVVHPAQMLSIFGKCWCCMLGNTESNCMKQSQHDQQPSLSIRRDLVVNESEKDWKGVVADEGASVDSAADTVGLCRRVSDFMGKVNAYLRCCNRWSYTYIGMYGYAFSEAGEKAIQLFETREWIEVVRDNLIQNVLLMASIVIGGSAGVFAVVVDETDGYDFTSFHKPIISAFVVGSVLGFVLSNILLLGVVGSAVNTILVCFAAGPFEFDMNHPRLSREMREAWSQQVWEPSI